MDGVAIKTVAAMPAKSSMPRARSDYRERLEDLRSELDETRSINDPGRAERVEQEIEFLTRELSSAYGLGGRARRSAAPVERARKAVSEAE
jgi:hypothetical protein